MKKQLRARPRLPIVSSDSISRNCTGLARLFGETRLQFQIAYVINKIVSMDETHVHVGL